MCYQDSTKCAALPGASQMATFEAENPVSSVIVDEVPCLDHRIFAVQLVSGRGPVWPA